MLTGETVSQLRVIGPAEPTPTHGDAHAVALGGVELLLDDAGERLEVGLGPDVLVDEHDGAVEQLAARSTISPAANLVPPMSTASTTGGSRRGGGVGAVVVGVGSVVGRVRWVS